VARGLSLAEFSRDIKLSHSVFALPFALSTFVIAGLDAPKWWQVIAIVLAMVSARSFAMGSNRLLDSDIDRENTRTANRSIPSGRLPKGHAIFWTLVFAMIFIVVSFWLNPVAGVCSIPVLVIIGSYPFWKKISWLTHWYLGMCLGLSPIAVEVAIASSISMVTVLLGCAVMFWTAGFDVLYALQDQDYDRSVGLHSVPAKFGVRGALYISRISFLLMMVFVLLIGVISHYNHWYFSGMAAIAVVLLLEHYLINDSREGAISPRLNLVFFNLNASISIVYLLSVLTQLWSV
jgi:4-hydroxybenzoate polyprenyltransferase